MASDPIYEGDAILLYCSEAKGFVFAQPPSSSYSHVTIYAVSNPDVPSYINDPAFPNVHFASFQVLAENTYIDLSCDSPLDVPKNHNHLTYRSLVYGRKIKLLHLASKMYLSLTSLSESGSINPSAKLVEDFDKDTCLFRILPARPGKHRGEDVLPEDPIKLESVSEKGHHVLCASNTITSRYELKMAVTDSVFVIYSQAKVHSHIPHKALRGCNVVMLFNVKREAYVAGRGSIATDILPESIKEEVISEVGARKRESVHGIQKAPPISGDCFWQLEKINKPLNGDQFEYGDKSQCRIKHLPTQQYLAVVQKGHRTELTLKKIPAGQPKDPEVTFSLVSVVGQTGGITKGSYVEIRHIHSGKNLIVQSKSYLQRTYSDISATETTPKSKWFKLGLEDSDPTHLQYFRLEEVNADLIHEYYHVSGVAAVLREYMKEFTANPKPVPFPPVLDELLEVLSKLTDWISGEFYKKSRANMLRVAQGVDLLVGFLCEINDLENKELSELCKKISVVLQRFVESSNKKSHLYLAEKRFMDVLFGKIGHGIDIEKVLSTLVRDESSITEKVVRRLTDNPEYTDRITNNLDASILDFLSTLCFTAGKPVRSLQNIIRNKIISFEKIFFFRTEIDQSGQLCFSSPEELKGPIRNICSKRTAKDNKKAFEFFVAQLKLFSRICKGVNLDSINFICDEKEYITFQEALICINDSELHPLLQSAYLDFVISAYVDLNVEESGTDIDNIWHSYYWDVISSNPMEGIGDTFAVIPNGKEIRELQHSIRTFLSENKLLYAKEEIEGKNELLAQMLSVLEPLVSYGFYWEDSEINEIIGVLIDIVDGMHDRPFPNANSRKVVQYQQKKRFKATEKTKKIFQVKNRAVRVLHFFFKLLSYTTLGKFIYDFKCLKSNVEVSSDDLYTPVNEALKALMTEDYHLSDQDPGIVEIARARLRHLFSENAYKCFDMNKSEGQQLIKILIDLLNYEDDELRLSSTLLLYDIYQEENIIFRDAQISYLVTPPSAQAFAEMVDKGSFSDDDKLLLRMLQGTATTGDLNENVKEFLNIVGDICIIEDDETQPQACNQGIAFSTGVFNVILTYVLQFCSGDHEDQRELLVLACHTLQRIARQNNQVQIKMFANFVDFLDVKIAVSSVARVLTEIVSNNEILCRNLSEADIRQVFTLASTGSTSEYYEFFTTLQAVMKPHKASHGVSITLKNYQELIARLFAESRHEYFGQIMLSDSHQQRLKLLIDADDNDDRLLQLLALSDLLATSSEGQCKYAENVCQTIYTVDELVSIISSQEVPVERKKPFARLLNWAYLNTEKDSLVSIAVLSKNELFWAHLERCSILMSSLHEGLSQGDIDTEDVKLKLRLLFSRHLSLPVWKEITEDLDTTLEIEDKSILISSLLLYLVDGLVPLVTAFCIQLSAHNSSGLTSKVYSSLLTPKVLAVLKSVGDAVAKLVKKHPDMLMTTEEQAHCWNLCLDSLAFIIPPEDGVAIKEARETINMLGKEFFTSPAMKEYEEELAQERVRNDEFQTFVCNYKTTYEGKTSTPRKDIIIYDEVNDDDLLPSGTSFNALVDLFSDEVVRNSDGKLTCHLAKTHALVELLNILYRQFQQPLTSKERSDLDNVLLTTLQVLSGVVLQKIESIDPQLQHDNPAMFEEEYENKVEPLQEALVKMKSHEKVMLHLAHPKDIIAVQVLAFLRVLLYFGYGFAQNKIGRLTKHRDTKFFIRINKLLESVISSIGQPLSRKLARYTERQTSLPLPPPPPAPPTQDETLEEPPQQDQEALKLLLDDVEEAGSGMPEINFLPRQTSFLPRQTSELHRFSLSSDDDDDDDEDFEITIEEETDFGGNFRRTIRAYAIEGAGQLETSESDAKKRASVVLDVVAWMCDGQNKEMQDILRKQDMTFSNVNIVGAISVLLQTLAEHFSEKTVGITRKTIQALIEMCAGNYTNQEVAFKGQIVDSANIILRSSTIVSLEPEDLIKVRASTIELLEVMLEETHENSKDLAEGISQDLDVDAVLLTMKDLYDTAQYCEQNEIEAKRGMYRCYHVLKKIADYLDTSVDVYVDFESKYSDDDMVNLWKHVSDSSRSIEINYETKDNKEILTRVYFPFDPSRELTEDEKDIVKNNIRRDSPEDKVKDLLEWMESVRKNVQHKMFVKRKWYLRWALFGSGIRHFLLAFLTLLMNVFVLALFEIPEEYQITNETSELTNNSIKVITRPDIPKWYSQYFIYIMGTFHFILSVWMLIEYFVREKPNILLRFPLLSNTLYNFKKWLDRYELLRRLQEHINKILCNGKFPEFKKPVDSQCFEVYFISFAPLYRILFVLCSLLALGTSGYFYCCCILYVFLKNDVLHQVLTAVRRSAAQLLSVGLLGLAVLLIYAVLSFAVLHNFFNPYDTDYNLFCNTLIQCYVTVIREGLLDTLGATLPLRYVGQSNDPSFTIYWTRTIFDITFFIIVTTLGLNIVVAILVDRFSELRSERDEIKKDKLNYCFVCGIDNDTFERKAKGFRTHVLNDHNMWNYIYFVLHLDSMYTNDHNALEKYVYDNIQARTISFFPLRRAKVLGGTVDGASVQSS